jgi:hypothetical protein
MENNCHGFGFFNFFFFLFCSSFSFQGSGTFYRDAQNVIFGSGGYNVTGTLGAFANRTGVMTALNHGAETDRSFEVHLVVQWK